MLAVLFDLFRIINLSVPRRRINIHSLFLWLSELPPKSCISLGSDQQYSGSLHLRGPAMPEAVIVSAVRTPVGRAYKGSLRATRPDDLAALSIKQALARVPGLEAKEIDDVILGCAMPEGEQGMNVARIAALRAGLPVETSAMTINRFCSSGLQAIALAAERIRPGSSSGAGVPHASRGVGAGGTVKPTTQTFTFSTDELPRADTNLEVLAKLKPAFQLKGTVTAGNSSPMSDGAAATVLMSDARARSLGLKPLARFVAFATAGVLPEEFGIGPVQAVPKALKLAGLSLNDIAVIELNEAFAAQSLAVIQQAGLDASRVNPNGGAIALGHPLGCTGAKLTATIIRELQRRNARYGMVTMCIGGGMGAAGIFERLS